MKKKEIFLFLLLFLISLFACRKNKNKFVDRGLSIFVDRFYEEAALREIDISDDNLEVVFRDLSEEQVCGLGHFRYKGTDLRKVEISTNAFCWDIHDDYGKESLVFHELGHAILKRVHSNTKMPNGLPARIMCDGLSCNLFSLYGKYTLGKRKYYVDKLFKLGTPTPAWGKLRDIETPIIIEDFENNSTLGAFEVSNTTYLNNFQYKIITNPNTNSKSVRIISKEKIAENVTSNWIIQLENPVISEGKGLKAKAKITTEDMEGDGVTMILQTYSGSSMPLDLSGAASNRTTIITGNQKETEYQIDIDYFPSEVQLIELTFRVLPNTSGTVYFDDIALSIME